MGVQMAMHQMIPAYVNKVRGLFTANLHLITATGMKAASHGQFIKAGDYSFDLLKTSAT
jgi:hypothetical protein